VHRPEKEKERPKTETQKLKEKKKGADSGPRKCGNQLFRGGKSNCSSREKKKAKCRNLRDGGKGRNNARTEQLTKKKSSFSSEENNFKSQK